MCLESEQDSQFHSYNRLLNRTNVPQMAHQTGAMNRGKLMQPQCRFNFEIAGLKLRLRRIQNQIGRQ